MPVLVVKEEGRPDRVVELGEKAVVIGRGEDAGVRVADPKVSSRHVRIRRSEAGEWIVRDLESTSGTLKNKRRILRARLAFGDVIRIGQTRVRFLEAAPSNAGEGPVVSGTLELKAVDATRAAQRPSLPARRAAPTPPSPPAPPAPPPPPARILDRKLMSRAVVLAVVGLLVLVGVELLLRPDADGARDVAQERRDLRLALEKVDISPETFEAEIHDFLAAYPASRHREALEAYIGAVRAREAERARRESELNTYLLNLRGLPESEVRGALIDLARTLPDDEDVALQIRLALDGLDRGHETRSTEALEAILRSSRTRIAQQDPAAAMRRLSAFRVAWPALSPDALGRLRDVEDEAIRAAKSLAETSLAAASKTEDQVERRRILARAWRGLEGTPQGERLADALRFTRGPSRPGQPTATPGAPGSTPTEPAATPGVLTKAAEAEQMARGRRWGEALTTLRGLITQVDGGPLKAEWSARIEELTDVVGLVDRLGEAASGEKKPKRRLPSGRVVVEAADQKSVTLTRGDTVTTLPWAQVADADLLPLLTPSKPRVEDRLGLAVLAAGMSEKDAFVSVLLPLFEKDDAPVEAGRLVARYLYGRANPPTGGYRAYKGELLDRAGYERRLRQERIAALETTAGETLARIQKESAFKKLDKLKAKRAELDKRRIHALLAIFNEKHYPYPANKQSQQYRAVQNEIDGRVAFARELWDDTTKVKISRKGTLGRALDTWDATLAELRKLGKDTEALEKRIAPYAMYVTGNPITIRDIFLNDAERRRFAYNRWVMETHNPNQLKEATDSERQQTLVTNEYRMLIGYAVVVTPGPASYEAIDDDNVGKILDQGKVEGQPVALLAVRIDDRLVRSARLHSLDMQKRGFFAHHAPPNPATGEPGTSPFDRMKTAGYQGGGASENIANGASNAEQAHWMWIHSSGHHRNILSPWTDQGVGRAGRLWTQNYGSGGGRRAVIEKDAAGGPQ